MRLNDRTSAREALAAAARNPAVTDVSIVAEAKGALRKQRGTLRNPEVEFVQRSERGVNFDIRHNQRLITQKAIEILLRNDVDELANFRTEVMQYGGFLFRYKGEGQSRLQNVFDMDNPNKGGWLMAEASGLPIDAHGTFSGIRVVGADAQVYVPPDNAMEADLDPPLPSAARGDRFTEGDEVRNAIQKNRSVAMIIADIVAVQKYEQHGFASTAEDACFAHVLETINRTRQHAIQYALAAVASLKSVQDSDGKLLTPQHDPGFRNLRSILLHTGRDAHAPGMILGQQIGRQIPVELPAGDPGFLEVDWWVTAQGLKGMQPKKDITLRYDQSGH